MHQIVVLRPCIPWLHSNGQEWFILDRFAGATHSKPSAFVVIGDERKLFCSSYVVDIGRRRASAVRVTFCTGGGIAGQD